MPPQAAYFLAGSAFWPNVEQKSRQLDRFVIEL
jgi:hypothetical protein